MQWAVGPRPRAVCAGVRNVGDTGCIHACGDRVLLCPNQACASGAAFLFAACERVVRLPLVLVARRLDGFSTGLGAPTLTSTLTPCLGALAPSCDASAALLPRGRGKGVWHPGGLLGCGLSAESAAARRAGFAAAAWVGRRRCSVPVGRCVPRCVLCCDVLRVVVLPGWGTCLAAHCAALNGRYDLAVGRAT